jgi:glutamate racemase
MFRIGVFDSGLGGLTIVHALQHTIKDAALFYIADTKHAPYGAKTPQEILQYSLDITAYLIDHYHIDALVVACNTATAFAIERLRVYYPRLVIVGTEPGLKPAMMQTRTGEIGILATQATLKGEKYRQLLRDLSLDAPHFKVHEQACVGLVEQIEAGKVESVKTEAMLEAWLKPMREGGVDTIVLGCTHYPLVEKQIRKHMPKSTTLIHTGEAIANRLHALRTKPATEDTVLSVTLLSTATLHQGLVEQIMGYAIPVRRISLH